MSDCSGNSEVIFQRVGARAWVHLDIAFGAEADDHLAHTLRQGWFPTSPATDLLFQMARPGDRVLDLGANIGQFCLPLAAMGCEVVAVEASPRNAQLLEASIARNQFHNLRLIHAAVSDREGTLEFCPAGPYGHVASSISNKPSVKVRAATVDQLLAEIGWDRVDYIKMDIEGSEVAALRGMARLLSRPDAPLMVYEANGYTLSFYNHTVRELKAGLEGYGYPNYLIEEARLRPVSPQDMQFPVVADYLAAKQLPPNLHGWELCIAKAGREELLPAALKGCASSNPVERAHMARMLQQAPECLLSEAAVHDALAALRNDPVPLVQESAAWSASVAFHTLRTHDIQFDIASPPEVDDAMTQAIRNGWYASTPTTELLFSMVQPGDRVLDLGANLGQFTLALAARGCQVLAVEASARNAEMLRASVARNHFANVRVEHAAASHSEGTLEFSPRGQYGHVSSTYTNLPAVKVRAVRVDRLLEEVGWDRVDFIKMDIEGSEIAAVAGMSRLLSRPDAPLIVYESNGLTLHFYNQTVNELKAALEKHGYRNYLVEPGRLIPVRAHDLQPNMVADHAALKKSPGDLPGWEIRERRPSRGERLLATLQACASSQDHERAHVARALRNAPGWLLWEPIIQKALQTLRNDHVPLVRADAAWSEHCPLQKTTKQKIIYHLLHPMLQQVRGVRHRAAQFARRTRRSA